MTLYEELKWRGLIKDEAGDDIESIINSCDATFYIGTDPTADSMHIRTLFFFFNFKKAYAK